MSKEFDYVAFAKEFEAQGAREILKLAGEMI